MSAEMLVAKYEELKKTYKVEHLLNKNKKIIFILESPHIDELINQTPVSGLSGKAMSKVLFGEKEKTPLGILTKNSPESVIGIMNICSIPMQRSAYNNDKVEQIHGEFKQDEYSSFFDVFEKLRTNTKITYKDQVKNDLQELILADFVADLSSMENEELILIPCGKTACVFFEAANTKNPKWNVIIDLPHPSYGNWYKEKYKDVVNQVFQLVNAVGNV